MHNFQTKTKEPLVSFIETDINKMLTVMGFDEALVSCEKKEKEDREGNICDHVVVTIKDKQSGRMLIGTHGAHLQALTYILKSMARKKIKGRVFITVDVNGYLLSREQSLLSLAEEAARKAGKTGRAIVLPPMGASDRHTVHAALAGRQGVSTESLGDEPNRRVVVRPVFI